MYKALNVDLLKNDTNFQKKINFLQQLIFCIVFIMNSTNNQKYY